MSFKDKIVRLKKLLDAQLVPKEGRELYIDKDQELAFFKDCLIPDAEDPRLFGFKIVFEPTLTSYVVK